MAAVHSSPQGNVEEGERVNVMLIWRWMCKEVLSVTVVSTAGLQSARQRLAEDLWSEDGLINGETRKILGGDDPARRRYCCDIVVAVCIDYKYARRPIIRISTLCISIPTSSLLFHRRRSFVHNLYEYRTCEKLYGNVQRCITTPFLFNWSIKEPKIYSADCIVSSSHCDAQILFWFVKNSSFASVDCYGIQRNLTFFVFKIQ